MFKNLFRSKLLNYERISIANLAKQNNELKVQLADEKAVCDRLQNSLHGWLDVVEGYQRREKEQTDAFNPNHAYIKTVLGKEINISDTVYFRCPGCGREESFSLSDFAQEEYFDIKESTLYCGQCPEGKEMIAKANDGMKSGLELCSECVKQTEVCDEQYPNKQKQTEV